MEKQTPRPRLIWMVFLLLGLIVVILAGASYLKSLPPEKSSSQTAAATTPPLSPFLPKPVPTATPLPAVAAATTPAPPRSPEEEVGELALSLRGYREAFGMNPVGNNAEITRALLGENPRNAEFIERSEVKLNGQGELVDHWGHPFFFHAITNKFMEVRSAGPDGVMFTADDIVGE